MSRIRPGDEDMHYCDGRHRWVPPDINIPQDSWEAKVRLHLLEHQEHHSGGSTGRR